MLFNYSVEDDVIFVLVDVKLMLSCDPSWSYGVLVAAVFEKDRGGSAPEIELSRQLGAWSKVLDGMESYYVKSFAEGLKDVLRRVWKEAE
nr:T-complex protein 1 subunit delta-like [Tanacetum cinerariifolium]